jgi:long-chain acyl-CoA synthetase
VSNICVYASTDAKQPIAIITPHDGNLRHAVQTGSLGVDADGPLSVLCHNDKVKELVLKECNAIGKKNGFKPMEILQAVILTAEEWTPENGLVTAAQKLQRKKIADMFIAEIKVRCVLVLIRGWFSNLHHTGGLQESMIVLSLVTSDVPDSD